MDLLDFNKEICSKIHFNLHPPMGNITLLSIIKTVFIQKMENIL